MIEVLATREYEKDGEKKYQTVIVADEMIMLGEPGAARSSRPANSDRANRPPDPGQRARQERHAPPPDDFEDSSIPF